MVCRGTSWLAGRLGERVAASAVTIIDDPVLPKALGSRPFDGEGVPARPMAVVAAGVLDRYLLDVRSARALGLPPTGRAVREREGAVTAGPTNLYVKPGPSSPKEIIGSVDQGLYLTELSGPGVNIATGDYSRAASGFWIEQGRLAFPVHEITIAGNLLDLWGRVEMVGADLVFRRPIAAPTLKIGRMVVAGAPSKSLFD